MGIRRKALNRPPITDPWVDAQYIAERYSLSYRTGLRWIDKLKELIGEEPPSSTDHRFKKRTRPRRAKRVRLSILEAHIDDLLN